MRYIYNIQGFNLRKGYCFEDINFTNKKIALNSLAYIREHWIEKLDLDTSNILNRGTTDDEQFIVEIDSDIRLTFTRKPIYTLVVKYVHD